jgi:PAS domain S-box-containing protein
MSSPSYAPVAKPQLATYSRLLQSPIPMWIFDRTTLQVLEVNEAATELYGYSRDEFLRMTILDFRPLEDIPKVLKIALRAPGREEDGGVWNHRKKDGTVFQAKVASWEITFQGRKATLVLSDPVRSASTQN